MNRSPEKGNGGRLAVTAAVVALGGAAAAAYVLHGGGHNSHNDGKPAEPVKPPVASAPQAPSAAPNPEPGNKILRVGTPQANVPVCEGVLVETDQNGYDHVWRRPVILEKGQSPVELGDDAN